MVKVIVVNLKVRLVYSNSEDNSWLNACVFLRPENIIATSNPLLLSLSFLKD